MIFCDHLYEKIFVQNPTHNYKIDDMPEDVYDIYKFSEKEQINKTQIQSSNIEI